MLEAGADAAPDRPLIDVRIPRWPAVVDLPHRRPEEDILVALVNLGYRRGDAERALAEVRRESAATAVPDLLRLALKRLARL